jgi:hypothetical protein
VSSGFVDPGGMTISTVKRSDFSIAPPIVELLSRLQCQAGGSQYATTQFGGLLVGSRSQSDFAPPFHSPVSEQGSVLRAGETLCASDLQTLCLR